MRLDIEPYELEMVDNFHGVWLIKGPGINAVDPANGVYQDTRHKADKFAAALKKAYIAGWNDRARDKS